MSNRVRREPRWTSTVTESVSRGLALFLGVFAAVGVGHRFFGAVDPNVWWIDLRDGPHGTDVFFHILAAIVLASVALGRPSRRSFRRLTAVTVLGIAASALHDAHIVSKLVSNGAPTSSASSSWSASLVIVVGCLFVGLRQFGAPCRSKRIVIGSFVTAGLAALLFPLLLVSTFGATDYRRPADVAVVLGARVYADGTPSQALRERVETACDLYRSGLVGKVVVSGGPGDGATHETDAMRVLAVQSGVSASDIIVDRDGLSTHHTVWNTERIFDDLGARRILAVSNDFHLPRIKLAYQLAGRDVQTVPAQVTRPLPQRPHLLRREVLAFWYYYFLPASV